MGTELAATFAAARNQHFNAAAAAAAATAPATVTRASTCPSSLPPTSTSIISPVANVVASSSGFAPKDSFVNTLVENYNTTVKKNQNLSDNSILSRHIKKDSILNDSSGGATVSLIHEIDNSTGIHFNKPVLNPNPTSLSSFKPPSLQASLNLSSSMKEAREEPYRKHLKSTSGGNLNSNNALFEFQNGHSTVLNSEIKGKPKPASESINTSKFGSFPSHILEPSSISKRISSEKNHEEFSSASFNNKPSMVTDTFNRNTKGLRHYDITLNSNEKTQISVENNKSRNDQQQHMKPLHISISSPSFNQLLNKSTFFPDDVPGSISRRKSLSFEPSNLLDNSHKDFFNVHVKKKNTVVSDVLPLKSDGVPHLPKNCEANFSNNVEISSKTKFPTEKSYRSEALYSSIQKIKKPTLQKQGSNYFSLNSPEPHSDNSSLFSFFPEENSDMGFLSTSIANLYHYCNPVKQRLSLLEGISDLKSHISATSMSIEVASVEEGLRSQILEFQLSLFQLREMHRQCIRMLYSFISESERSALSVNKQFSTLREQMTGFTIIDSLEYRIESVQAMIESRTKKLEKINSWVAKQEDILIKNKKRIQKFWKFGLLLSSLGLFLIIVIYLFSIINLCT